MNNIKLDLRHSYLRGHIKKLENINLGLNEDIDSHTRYLEDVESIEEMKVSYYNLLVSVSEQSNLINESVEELKGFNNNLLLNQNLGIKDKISPFRDVDYMKEIIKTRY